MNDLNKIQKIISEIPFVSKVLNIEENNSHIKGKVEINFDDLDKALVFEFIIYPQYPFKKAYDSESIDFINEDLIEYCHVMRDGSICIHTSHHTDFERKLLIDFHSLKAWIVKYYINKEKDVDYEHIIVQDCLINDNYFSYIFTDVDYKFNKNDFGEVIISPLAPGIYKGKVNNNYYIKSFKNSNHKQIYCKWSTFYKNLESSSGGLYIYIEDHPAKYNRFIFENWLDFEKLFPQTFLDYLHNLEMSVINKNKGKLFPIFIGYRTIDNEIHWQVAMLKIGKFPLMGNAKVINGKKIGKWNSKLTDTEIQWAITRNSSYKYFFGRGKLCDKLTNSKILIIGIGAIGSMLAKTLVRGGCKQIYIADYDMKEPENVCRSEYFFNSGISEKVDELRQILSSISPFVDIVITNEDYFKDIIKGFWSHNDAKKEFSSVLNQFDMIFDCTTDNDLMHILDSLDLKGDLINLSVTNHANEMVCAFYPGIYNFVSSQYKNILVNDLTDLYNPTGCWSPTFKASYNDINLLVQTAINHINILYKNKKNKNNFIIKPDIENNLNVKITEY